MTDLTGTSQSGDYRIESPSTYIPMDRRHALAQGIALPERLQGTALFADISGFTPLTEMLARELGPQRGSEEITRQLNCLYDAILAPLHNYGGSVIGFSGDAVTCWFDGDSGLRAVAAGLDMQNSMQPFINVRIPSGKTLSLAMKVVIASGPARRFVVGDPKYWVVDVLAGETLDTLATVEGNAAGGEVALDYSTAKALEDKIQIASWREPPGSGLPLAIVAGVLDHVAPMPWASLPEDALSEEVVRPWLLPAVYTRLRSGLGEFLAELRPAVALFMNFTGIDYDVDEQAQTKLDRFIRQVQDILAHYDGTLIQLTFGDKGSYLYAAFGAPSAHEDDAHRAASAALELRNLGLTLELVEAVKIGLTQGRMRTGSYGGSMMRTYGVLGDATNLSARLMQAAAPGQILASNEVYQAIANGFIWEALPRLQVKGKSDPIAVFSLTANRPRQATQARENQTELPMVGRERELALVAERLEVVTQGRGQIVGITAGAGMGKSRLVAEVVRFADERGWQRYGGECSSYGTNTSYHVWHSIWWHFFGLDQAWPLAAQIHALEGQLAGIDPTLVARLPLLGAALNLPIPDNDLTATFDAKLRKSSLEALLVDCLRARSQDTPVLVLLEDCHWLDSLSYDLLDVMANAIVNLPVLLLLAYRPPQLQYLRMPKVSALSHFVGVELDDFTADEARQLITLKLAQAYGSSREVPAELTRRVTERAEGNPFYIEEILNYLRTQGIDPQDREALAKLDLPTSLQSLILSRVDQLSESERITLKVASVVGRLFEAPTLSGYYPQLGDASRIMRDLETLSSADLTELQADEPDLTYAFRHVLTQEVAYESLPFATRAVLHENLAAYIERTAGARVDQYVDQLAFHYGRSENVTKKREYLLKAGKRAQATYNNTTAIDYYQQVLPLVESRERVTVLLKLAQVLDLVGRWQEANDVYLQALAQASQMDDLLAVAQCETALGEHLRKRGMYKEAASRLSEARARFEQLGDLAGVGQTLHYAGSLTAQQGDFEGARSLFESSLTIRRQLDDRANIASLLSNLGNVARLQGEYDQARSLHEEGLTIRQDLGDKWAIAVSLNNLGNVARSQGDLSEARRWLEQAIALQREVGDRAMLVNALNDLGNVVRDLHDLSAAQLLYTEALQINRGLDNKWASAYLFEDVGCLATWQDQPERALKLVAAASVLRQSIGAPLTAAEQDRLQQWLNQAKERLTVEAQLAAEAEGRALSYEQAIELALRWTDS